MKSYPFKKLDAFATRTSNGNPAAIIGLTCFEDITETLMQRIGAELKGFVSEVAFIAQIAPDAFKVRYFSSEKEVQFCGHATICLAYDSIANNPSLASLPRIFLNTNKGILPVENRIQKEDSVYIHAPVPVYTQCGIGLTEICTALNIAESAVDPAIDPGIVNAGNQTLCFPLKSLGRRCWSSPEFQRAPGLLSAASARRDHSIQPRRGQSREFPAHASFRGSFWVFGRPRYRFWKCGFGLPPASNWPLGWKARLYRTECRYPESEPCTAGLCPRY